MSKTKITQSVLTTLECTLENLKEQFNADQKKLTEDFEHNLTWVVERMVKSQSKIKRLTSLLEEGKENNHGILSALEENKRQMTESALRAFNVRTSSSCEMTAAKSTWVHQANLELLEIMQGCLNRFN